MLAAALFSSCSILLFVQPKLVSKCKRLLVVFTASLLSVPFSVSDEVFHLLFCRATTVLQKLKRFEILLNTAFCLTKAATNNTNVHEYFSTICSLSSHKLCQTVNIFLVRCSSFCRIVLSAVCDCLTSFLCPFLELR